MNGYADDLVAVIEALDLRGATLVGHSTGGEEVAPSAGTGQSGSPRRALIREGSSQGLDASRMAVANQSVGVNMAAALTLMARHAGT